MKSYKLWLLLGLAFFILFLYNAFLGFLVPSYVLISLALFILADERYRNDEENKKEPF